jgi:nucleoside-diphosphate-sugar epimerase
MQTILGAGGAIGDELAKSLASYTKKIRLVSRNPEKVNETDEVFKADLSDKNQVSEAVKDSEVVYLVVGLKYDLKVWKSLWPRIMTNVIQACKEYNSRLVFFDNVYMYGKVDGIMTEDTPVNPCSRKGEIRAQIAQMLLHEIKNGNLKALIARSADFYGPNVANSIPEGMIVQNLKKGKKAQLPCADHYLHSYTFTPDAGKATAILGNSDKAYNQVWHLPTDEKPMIGKEWVEAIAKALHAKPDYMVLRKWMIRIFGVFNPIVGELYEMLYQYDRDYIFGSAKFEREFDFQPTSYKDGIKQIVEAV